MAILFAMYYNNLTISISIGKIACHLLSAVDRSMLAASATEGDLEAGEVTFHVFLHALSYEGFRMVEKLVDGGFALQELDDGTVFARVSLVFGVASGIGQCSAVEDETATVARGVLRETTLVAETADGHR